MDGEQFWWTPTVPPATAPSPDAPQCTGESRNVREDFHTLPQSVLVTTAWDNTVPHFDLELFNQQTAMKDCLDRSPALGNSQQEYHTKCSANCSHAQTALMPNNHTDEYRADTTEKRMLTQKCRQTITNSWERATRTRDQQRCNCLHGIGVPCSRHVQSHSSPAWPTTTRTKQCFSRQQPRSDTAKQPIGGKMFGHTHGVGQETSKHDSNPKHEYHDATSRMVVENQATRELQALSNSTMIPHRVCKCASFQRNLWKTTFPQLMLTASLKKHSGNDFNFTRMANNLGRHQPYPQQHHPAKMHLNAQENRAVFGKTFTHSHSPSDCRRRGTALSQTLISHWQPP